MAAERQARRLLRRLTVEQLIYSRTQATTGQDDHAWKRRTLALIESNPRQVTESSAQALFQAAAYPEAIAAAEGSLHPPANAGPTAVIRPPAGPGARRQPSGKEATVPQPAP